MTDEHTQRFKDFEKAFGFDTWEELKEIMGKMWGQIEELKLSRDNWKKKYFDLKAKKEVEK